MADASGGLYFSLLGNLSSYLYAQALTTALAQQRTWDPSYALRQDVEILEKLSRDAVTSHALRYRRLLIAGTGWFLEPASADPKDLKVAEVLTGLLEELPSFGLAIYNLTEAEVASARYARLYCDDDQALELADEPPMFWVRPTALQDVDKRRFLQQRIDRGDTDPKDTKVYGKDGALQLQQTVEHRVDYPWSFWRPNQRAWVDAETLDEDADAPIKQWVSHIVDNAENFLGYGHGLADDLYHYVWMKEQLLQYVLAWCERWGQGGFLVAKVETLVGGQLSAENYTKQRDQIITDLNAMRSRNALAVPTTQEVQVLEPQAANVAFVMECVRYCDEGITRLCLGSILPTGGSEGTGSLARAKEEATSTALMVAHGRMLLEEDLTRDLVRVLWKLNAANWEILGLEGRRPSKFKIRQEREYDPKQEVDSAIALVQAGIPILKKELYSRIKYSMPLPGDDVFEQQQPAGVGLGDLAKTLDPFAPSPMDAQQEQQPPGKGAPKPKPPAPTPSAKNGTQKPQPAAKG
jgi:hypothetical protein